MSNHQTTSSKRLVLPWIRFFFGALLGILLAIGAHKLAELDEFLLFVATSAVFGGLVGLSWKTLVGIGKRFDSEDWKVTEVEISTLGQTWKLASGGSQRRTAWALFVELTTRIATQPLADEDGDDSAAINSLYVLFQSTRKIISEMEPSQVLPVAEENIYNVETYALAMLNQDLRPFLSKWHPVCDAWQKTKGHEHCSTWDQHLVFRAELKCLQTKIVERAKGLAKIAGVLDVDRLMPPTPQEGNGETKSS